MNGPVKVELDHLSCVDFFFTKEGQKNESLLFDRMNKSKHSLIKAKIIALQKSTSVLHTSHKQIFGEKATLQQTVLPPVFLSGCARLQQAPLVLGSGITAQQ